MFGGGGLTVGSGAGGDILVRLTMFLQVGQVGKGLIAHVALVRLLACGPSIMTMLRWRFFKLKT